MVCSLWDAREAQRGYCERGLVPWMAPVAPKGGCGCPGTVGARWARQGCELGLLQPEAGGEDKLWPQRGHSGRRPYGTKKLGEHEGQPSFSGLSRDPVCVHCVVGKAVLGSSEGPGLVSPEDPNDQST